MPEYYTFRLESDGIHFETHQGTKPEAEPLEVKIELVPLAEINLDRLWNGYTQKYGYWDHTGFLEHVRGLVRDPEAVEAIKFCTDCIRPGLEHTHVVERGYVCGECLTDYDECVSCGELARYTTNINGDDVCRSCRDTLYTYCEPCAVWYASDDEEEQHNHGGPNCKCESPPASQRFTVRNDGNEPLANDEKVTVTLPSGVISEEGMEQIAYSIRQWARRNLGCDDDYYEKRTTWYNLAARLDEVGAKWQAKQGNFTKRLSRFAYKEFDIKVSPELLSQIGNIASQHSGGAEYRVAFTRNLNLSPDQFANYDSCWWGSYAASRCALKSNGGLALRTFNGYGQVTGRAWVMPLRQVGEMRHQAMLVPTFETLNADAFIVFNGYGDMHGYLPARIMAHLAGMTYRKVGFYPGEADHVMYVNNESGYLVAPEEIADHYNDGSLDLQIEVHSNLFDREMKENSHVA